jgi:ribose/xylose/arabinose/galactoside ABC-type transport system permease subunit
MKMDNNSMPTIKYKSPVKKFNIRKMLTTELYLGIFIVVVLIVLNFTTTGFFSLNNIMSILNRFSYVIIAAIGMNMIIITSNIDVSTGALISVVCIVIAVAGKQHANILVLLPIAIVTGAVLSLINGLFITKLKIPAIVATLATAQLFAGFLPLVVEGSIYDLPSSFTWLAFNAKVFGVMPASVLFSLIIIVISIIFMKYSRFSKKLYAVGNNRNGARLSGINVDKVVIISYVIAGALFGVSATIIATSSQRVTTTMGSGLAMTFIAAVVLGGTSIAGGSGKVLGTVLGALILSIISPAVTYLGISSDWSDAIMGTIIIVSVIVGAMKYVAKKRKKVNEKIVAGGVHNETNRISV